MYRIHPHPFKHMDKVTKVYKSDCDAKETALWEYHQTGQNHLEYGQSGYLKHAILI